MLATRITTSLDTTLEVIELRPQELHLLKQLRSNFAFGEVTIVMHNGIPQRLRRITEFAELDTVGKK